MRKIAVVTLLLLSISAVAYAVDIIDEGVLPWYVGVPGSYQLTACCGTAPYTFTLHSGSFPSGISMNSSGLISGTSNTAGYTTACITVTDVNGRHVTRCYEIYVF
jgi:Putative Ig domain